jgi:hypothetical protein
MSTEDKIDFFSIYDRLTKKCTFKINWEL